MTSRRNAASVGPVCAMRTRSRYTRKRRLECDAREVPHTARAAGGVSRNHDSLGTTYNHMLKNFNYPQDGLCLQCHWDIGILR